MERKWLYLENLHKRMNDSPEMSDFNHDVEDCAGVLAFMCERSESIKMYCGEMLLFKTKLKAEIERLHKEQDEKDLTIDGKIAHLRGSVKKFINEGKKLEIVMQNAPGPEFWNEIDEAYLELLKNDNVTLKYLPDDAVFLRALSHFSFSETKDNRQITRDELDHPLHRAFVSGKKKENAYNYSTRFQLLKEVSLDMPMS